MWNATIVKAPIRFYCYILLLVLIAFPLLSVSVAYNLNRLETWRVDSVSIPAPIAAVYDAYGFGPAVAVVPIIGLGCCLVFLYRIQKLRTAAKQQGNTHDVAFVPDL